MTNKEVYDYPYNFEINCKYQELIDKVKSFENHHIDMDNLYKIQCRVMLKRTASSKLYFLTVTILNGENLVNSDYQVVIAKHLLTNENNLEVIKKIKLGDIIGINGYLGKTKIGELCRVWASFMLESKYWRENFVFLTLSTFNNKKYKKDPKITIQLAVEKGLCHREDHPLDLKELIIEVEKEALRKGKGLVILSGDVAKMGISLKCVDVVFLMSNNKEADDIIQKMYRALTESTFKKNGYIIDMNYFRTITSVIEYQKEKMKLLIIRHLDD